MINMQKIIELYLHTLQERSLIFVRTTRSIMFIASNEDCHFGEMTRY